MKKFHSFEEAKRYAGTLGVFQSNGYQKSYCKNRKDGCKATWVIKKTGNQKFALTGCLKHINNCSNVDGTPIYESSGRQMYKVKKALEEMKFSSMDEANKFLITRGYDAVFNKHESSAEYREFQGKLFKNSYICHRNGKYHLTGTRRIRATKKNLQDSCNAYCSITKIGESFILRGNFEHNHNDIHDRFELSKISNKQTRRKKFDCHKCDFKTVCVSNLKGHIKSVHDKIKDRVCQHCGYVCSLRSSLDNHIKSVHLKLKNYVCEECGYSAFLKSGLLHHQQSVHLNTRNYICEQCGMAFNTKATLNNHKNVVHLKIKKFVC